MILWKTPVEIFLKFYVGPYSRVRQVCFVNDFLPRQKSRGQTSNHDPKFLIISELCDIHDLLGGLRGIYEEIWNDLPVIIAFLEYFNRYLTILGVQESSILPLDLTLPTAALLLGLSAAQGRLHKKQNQPACDQTNLSTTAINYHRPVPNRSVLKLRLVWRHWSSAALGHKWL